MKLFDLWQQTNQLGTLIHCSDQEIKHITRHSNHVAAHSLFLCRQGRHFDSHTVIEDVASRGTCCCVVQKDVESHVPLWRIPANREGEIAAAFYGHPSRKMTILGVTGTDGKSTTAWFAAQLLQACGYQTACLGTLGVWQGHTWTPWELTTPESEVLQKTLYELEKKGFTHVVLEASSHGLSQGRVCGIEFDAVALTNLGRDHLDDYGSLEKYHQAKELLFSLQKDPQKQVRPSQSPGNAFWRIDDNVTLKKTGDVIDIVWDKKKYSVSDCVIEGEHNFKNMATSLALVGCALEQEKVIQGINQLKPLPGRWQWVTPCDRRIMVDYAHTPHALQYLLKSVRPYVSGQLHVLFGCGGERDQGKRSLMGEVACKHADKIWITDDNPRFEDPQKIRQEIYSTIDMTDVVEIADRRQAIEQAVCDLKDNDLLVIAGKGHESYQIINGEKIDFDDVEVAREICLKVPHG